MKKNNYFKTGKSTHIKVLSNSQMKAAEQLGMSRGIPSLILMENAAYNIKKFVLRLKPKNVLVFAGRGNNGGDGLAAARQLIAAGIAVGIVFVGDRSRATADCTTNLKILDDFDADIYFAGSAPDFSIIDDKIAKADVIIDALIGTGLSRPLASPYNILVSKINSSGKRVVAADCPTGINTDTGEDYGIAVNAYATITFHCPKMGMLLYPAFSHVGRLIVGDIGMPYGGEDTQAFVLTRQGARDMLPRRHENSHKGTYGKAVIIGGCSTMTGAVIFNARAAYNSGCGLVRLCTVRDAARVVQNAVPEAVTAILKECNGYIDDDCAKVINDANCIALGSGMGNTESGFKTVNSVLTGKGCPIVLDADALNIIARHRELYDLLDNTVITPHIKEMSRLTGLSLDHITGNIPAVALDFAKKHNTVVVLKAAHTVIASPTGRLCINLTGCSAMSKGGSGDCLTGTIAGLIAQKTALFDAAVLGAYINGLAGENAAKKYGEYGVSATNITENISKVMKKLCK